jgi:hypothetical protein
MTRGPRASVAGGGACEGELAGRAGPSAELGCARAVARETGCSRVGPEGEGVRRVCLFFYFLLNTQSIEFKQRFESKHSKTMHRHECNRELLNFIN